MLAAEFTKGRQGKLDTLDIVQIVNGQRAYVETHEVMGKREARKVAQALAAKPWNF